MRKKQLGRSAQINRDNAKMGTRAIGRSHRERNGGLTPVDMIAAILRCNLRLLVREFALLHKEFRCGFVSVAAFTRERCARSAQAPACML
jgi:hypothetical protein